MTPRGCTEGRGPRTPHPGPSSPAPAMAGPLPCCQGCTFASTNWKSANPQGIIFNPLEVPECLAYTGLKNPSSFPTDSTHKYVSFLANAWTVTDQVSIVWPRQGGEQSGTWQLPSHKCLEFLQPHTCRRFCKIDLTSIKRNLNF